MKNLAISARGLGKQYRRIVRSKQHDSLRDVIQAGVADLLASKQGHEERQERQTFWALRDADFDIAPGQNVGIIGLNGSGKSTLLKLLSRITAPTAGNVRICGRLGALLEVGTGFHQELTGRENVFLYGAILGMTRKEVAAKFDAIVDFSEIEAFIDTPVKRYSSGMYVRLAFAVAAHLDPDILLLDEVLAVGDFAFQRKCMEFTRRLEKNGATILFVSHNMFSIKAMCQRVIYLKKGEIVFDGPTDEGLDLYENGAKLQNLHWFSSNSDTPSISATEVAICNEAGRETSVLDFGERMCVRIRYVASRRIERPDFRVGITRGDEVHCATFSTISDKIDIPFVEGEGAIQLLTPPIKLVSDRYNLKLVVRERRAGDVIAAQLGGSFHVRHPVFVADSFGVFHEPAIWQLHSMGHDLQQNSHEVE